MHETPTILQRVAVGDRTAVDDCIEQYGGLIWTIGKRYLCDVSDLEDVTQEVFIELWQKAGRFDPQRGTESSFVALVARRRVTDRLRRSSAAKNEGPVHSIEEFEEMDEFGVSDVDSMIWGEEITRTASCLEKLEQIRRRVLIMHLRDGESHGRIADILQLPLGTIKSHARRGLLQMQRCVGVQVDVEPTPSLAKGDAR